MRVVWISLSVAWLASASARAEEPRLALKVLNAGKGGTERSRDFGDFLRGRVAVDRSAEFAGFRDRDADGYDVEILDGDLADLERFFDRAAEPSMGWPDLSTTYACR